METGTVINSKKVVRSRSEDIGPQISMSETVDAVTAQKMEEEKTYKNVDEFGKKENQTAPQMPFGSGPPTPGGPGG